GANRPGGGACRCYLGRAPGGLRPPIAASALPATSTSLDGNEDSPAPCVPVRRARRPARRVWRGWRFWLGACGFRGEGGLDDDHEGEPQLADELRVRQLQDAGTE